MSESKSHSTDSFLEAGTSQAGGLGIGPFGGFAIGGITLGQTLQTIQLYHNTDSLLKTRETKSHTTD